MLRASWKLSTCSDSLWTTIVRSKYKCGMEEVPKVNKLQAGSNFWHGICSNWDMFFANLSWTNGSKVKFWMDSWVPHAGPLLDHAVGFVPIEDILKSIIDFVSGEGSWIVSKFSQLVPAAIANRITAMVPPHRSNIDDCIAWKNENDGAFTLS